MTLDTIKDAVMLLEDPILIMESATVKDSVVLFGEVYTSGNKPVMISVLLNPKTKSGEVLDYAVITSAYGRRTGNLQHLIDSSRIYYVNENKNRTENWLKALGLQLPSAITKFGPIASINDSEPTVKERFSYAGENAKTADLDALETAKEMREAGVADTDSRGSNLSPEQQVFFANSKVRDENGRLLPVYHGSKNSGFNVFQYSEKAQTGTDYGKAFYFTSDYAKMLDALEKGLSVDQYLDMRLKGTDIDRYLELVNEGMGEDMAYEFSNYLEELESSDDGEIGDLTRWRASVDFSDDVDDQLAALSMVMSDSQMQSVEVANEFGINPKVYVDFYETRSQYDADGNGSYKQAEIQAAIDARFGNLSKEQKAVLWQVMNSSTKSAKNNPYSQTIGQKVLDAKAAAKAAAEQEKEPEGLTLGNW